MGHRPGQGSREMAGRSQYNPKRLCSVFVTDSSRGLGSRRLGEDVFVIPGYMWDWKPCCFVGQFWGAVRVRKWLSGLWFRSIMCP